MPETQREPVPRVDTGELDVAHAFLKFQRHCVLKKAEGLTDEQLRRPLVQAAALSYGVSKAVKARRKAAEQPNKHAKRRLKRGAR